MKLKNTFLIGIIAMAGLSSCVSESLKIDGQTTDKVAKGYMKLDVSQLNPEVTRAQSQVTNYPVKIYDAEGNVVESYEAVSQVPSMVVLAVGNYTVESHTPGVIEKKMSYPYYKGGKEMEIIQNYTTQVEVVCKMENSRIQVSYDADFLNTFETWTITIDDGSETVLTFTEKDGNSPAAVYWYFDPADNVTELTLNFRATTKSGSTVSARRTLTKESASETYNTDETFTGGDAVVINFTPTENTEGQVVGINISASVTFEETSGDATLDVTDAGLQEDPNQGGGGDDPQTEVPITLDLPENMTVSAATEKSKGDTYIKCDDGIKSIKVIIQSTSDEMLSSLSELNDNYGVNFLTGAEIVDNQQVVKLFEDLNQPLSVPSQGDIDYTFPIGNFFGLLGFLSGQHTFNMVVEDMNGKKKNGSLTLTVE